jgi:tetratricopeptide (TPR) repeat protein
VDRFALFVRKARPLVLLLCAAGGGTAAQAIEAPKKKPETPAAEQKAPAPESAPAPAATPAPDPPTAPVPASAPPAPAPSPDKAPAGAPATAPNATVAAPSGGAAPAGPPPTREEQKSVYHDFRAAYDAKRYADARPLAERAVQITEQLDGRDVMELVTPLNNLAQTAYALKDYSAAEEAYLRSIKIIETRAGSSPRLSHTLYGLGRVYVAAGQDEFAVTMFKRAVEITRKTDGLFSTSQLPFLYPLIDAYERTERVADADREEQYLVSIAERNYNQQSPQFIAAIERQAAWQERQYKFVTARHYWARAIEFTRRAGDVRDIRQVNQLRGLARCYRGEYLFGAADEETQPPVNEGFQLGGSNPLAQNQGKRLDPEGARLLQSALTLLQNANGPLGTRLKRDTTIDLGDWNWIEGDYKDAADLYATAWDLMTSAERASTGPDNPLAQPVLLFYAEPRAATKNPKAKPEDIEEKFVEMEFPVNEKGKVGNVKVTGSDASESLQKSVMNAMHRALYRPRMVDRKLAATEGVKFREVVYAKR